MHYDLRNESYPVRFCAQTGSAGAQLPTLTSKRCFGNIPSMLLIKCCMCKNPAPAKSKKRRFCSDACKMDALRQRRRDDSLHPEWIAPRTEILQASPKQAIGFCLKLQSPNLLLPPKGQHILRSDGRMRADGFFYLDVFELPMYPEAGFYEVIYLLLGGGRVGGPRVLLPEPGRLYYARPKGRDKT